MDKFIVSNEEVDIVKNQISEVYSAIQSRSFEVGCGEEDCRWCNFVKYNKLDISNSGEAEGDEREEVIMEPDA